MHIENAVKTQTTPWFMDESRIPAKLASLEADIRPYAQSMIDNGFSIIRGGISRDRCEQLIARFRLFADANPDKFQKFLDKDGHYPRIVNLHVAMPELFELFATNRLAYRVQQALWDATPCLYTSLFYERGSAQPPHRDTPLFATRPEYFYFGVWTALEDATPANGALQVYRGGHKLPELDREAIAMRLFGSLDNIPAMSNDLWMEYQGQVDQQCKDAGLELQSLYVNAGDTIIWHPQLPHGGGPIADMTKSRFSLVMHTTPVGAPVFHQDRFFNPRGDAPLDAPWQYEQAAGAYRVIHDRVDFDHKESFAVAEFNVPPLEVKAGEAANKPASLWRRLFG